MMIYIFSYYKIYIFVPLIIVILAGSFVSERIRKKEDILYLGLINVSAGEDLTLKLDQGFVSYLEENANRPEIFEYPKTGRLITDDGRDFYDS